MGGRRTQLFAKMDIVGGGGLGFPGPLETSLYVSSRVWSICCAPGEGWGAHGEK